MIRTMNTHQKAIEYFIRIEKSESEGYYEKIKIIS